MTKKEYFSQLLPQSPTAECSHRIPSMLTLASSDTNNLNADTTTAQFNGYDLDDIQENSRMIKARQNEKIDIARKAIGEGQKVADKINAKKKSNSKSKQS